MADPLSIAASIIAVLQLTSQVVSLTYKFLAAGNSQGIITNFRQELRDLEELLLGFQRLIDEHPHARNLPQFAMEELWLQECHTLLEEFITKLSQPKSRLRQIGQRLAWPLKEKDMAKLAAVISQKKASATLGLALDQMNTLLSVREDTSSMYDKQHGALRKRILDWLAPLDVESNFDAARERHHKRTGEWFLHGRDFLEWKQGDQGLLWLHGIPGCGKTILASTIIDDLQTTFQFDSSVGLAFFFFTFADPEKQTVSKMLCTIAAQLFQKLPNVPDIIEVIYNQNSKPTSKVLFIFLEALLGIFKGTYIVIDALDEVLVQERKTLFWALQKMADHVFQNLKIIVTSRREQYIKEGLEALSTSDIPMDTTIVDSDIRHFVSETLVQDVRFKKWGLSLQSDIESTLVSGAHGMFRWVECQLEALRTCRNANAVKKALSSLPKTLDDTYSRILLAIPDDDIEFAKKALMWLVFSLRPMSVEEIAEAIIVQPGSRTVDPDERFAEPCEVLSLCGSLITMADNNEHWQRPGHVKLAHYSVKEYLVSERVLPSRFSFTMRDAPIILAEVCLAYLGFEDFCEALPDEGLEIEQYPLLQYASNFWGEHIALVSSRKSREKLGAGVVDILGKEEGCFNNWLSVFNPYRKLGYRTDRIYGKAEAAGSALYYFALFGLDAAVRLSISRGADMNVQGGEHVTALAAASYGGYHSIVLLLLEHGADVNAQDRYGHAYTPYSGYCHTALQAAIQQDHDSIAYLLIEKGADINGRGSTRDGTALRIAVDRNNEEMVRFLLKNGANANARTDCGTVLAAAAGRGNLGLVLLLLEHGASVSAWPWEGGRLSALAAAVFSGSEEIVELLISYGAEINALNDITGGRMDAHYCTALRIASEPYFGDDRCRRAKELLSKFGVEIGPEWDYEWRQSRDDDISKL